jgi:hypothetical protein
MDVQVIEQLANLSTAHLADASMKRALAIQSRLKSRGTASRTVRTFTDFCVEWVSTHAPPQPPAAR